MAVLGDVKINRDASCKKADFVRCNKNAQIIFKTNKNTEKECQTAFLWDWLGATGKTVLECHKRSEADNENEDTIFDKLEQKCHPGSNKTLYKNHFFTVRQSPSETFLNLYHDICHIYDL